MSSKACPKTHLDCSFTMMHAVHDTQESMVCQLSNVHGMQHAAGCIKADAVWKNAKRCRNQKLCVYMACDAPLVPSSLARQSPGSSVCILSASFIINVLTSVATTVCTP